MIPIFRSSVNFVDPALPRHWRRRRVVFVAPMSQQGT
ncbi:MAG: phage Gp37/Gp68 family protein [Candidatus Accumulibacter sp.]|nr:phage Gp37/Gp68 family protein [Accumulibacter sp.]